MPDSAPILSFDLPKGRGKKSFDTLDEFEAWMAVENAWWNKLGGGQGQNNDSYGQWLQFVRSVNEKLGSIKNPGSSQSQKDRAVSEIRTALYQYYSQQQFPNSDSPEGLIVTDYFQRDPNLAYGFLATMAVPNIGLQNRPITMWGGFLLGCLYRVGMLKEAKVDQDYLASVEKDWRERLEKLSLEMAETNSSSRSFLEEIKMQRDLLDVEKERQEREFSDQNAKFEKDIGDLRDRYDRKLAFRAPVTYWTGKAKAHVAAIVWGVVWLLVGGFSVFGIFSVIKPFLAPESKIDYQHGAVLFLLSGFAIWLMQILTRMFLSSVHQHSDAGQGKTMVETYSCVGGGGQADGRATEHDYRSNVPSSDNGSC